MSAPICHINLAPTFRGSERQTELLIRGISQWGIPQRVIGSDVGQLVANLEGLEKLEIVATSSHSGAAKACKGSRLVHAHDPLGIAAAQRAYFFSSVPYILTHREQRAPSSGFWVKRSYHKAKRVIALSRAIKKNLCDYSANLDPQVIPSCASAHQTFATTIQSIADRYADKFVVGHVGSLIDSRKGQSDLIQVAKQMGRIHPDMVFVFIGAGPDDAALKAQAEGLNNVEFVGAVPNIGDYLCIMSVFAYPAREEGFGATLLDAMDYSLPVVATAVGGIPELVQDGVNGLLVSAGNIDQLSFALQRLYEDRALGMRLGQDGNSKAQNFTPEIMIERYLELYQQF